MTKEIIIDGVDISECKYSYLLLRSNECGCYAESERAVKITLCKNCPNCYFKQLKRAEKKLEKIKDIMTQCNQNAKCGDCKYGYLCKGYLFMDGMILQIIEGEENG